jgi:hypothetical protein|tara:strand:- start:1029 stop:2006 length:978 start_codon:yes stop_codon:yes gene_type:complete
MTENKSQRSTQSDGSRQYTDADGNKYDSVTTIISGGVPKPFLMGWSNKLAGEYAIEQFQKPIMAFKEIFEETVAIADDPEAAFFDEAPIFDRMRKGIDYLTAKKDKEVPDSTISLVATGQKGRTEEARKRISTASNLVRDAAASRGSFVHDLIEQYVLSGKLPEIDSDDEDAAGMLVQFEKFLNDWEPEFTAAEMVVFNNKQRYAGTLDFLANIPKIAAGTFIGDVKTGNRIYPEVALQLAAYAHAEFYETQTVKRTDAGETMPMPELNGKGVVLHLRPDYYELVPAEVGKETFDLFSYCHQVYWFTKNGGKYLDTPYELEENDA